MFYRMYKVVLFDNEEVEVVPHTWLENEYCFWPSKMKSSKILKAVNQKAKPDENWTTHKIIKILYESGILFIFSTIFEIF